ncbi:MAG: polyhydroxybutyrate depolymerase [Roseobacter sp.]
MKSPLVVFATYLFTLLMPFAAHACGGETRCQIGDRHYYIALPDRYDSGTPIPALIFAHGFQGSALGIIRNPRLRKVANDLGIAFIAVKSLGQSWSTNNSPRSTPDSEAVELAYFDAVKKDVTSRFPINPDKIVMSGASTGGMLTWTLACERSDAFAGFIPMSGTFWAPVPRRCSGRVANIVHFHGDKDKTVPLNGRPVAGTHQGSVPKALAMYRAYGDFDPSRRQQVGGLRCENSKNSARNILNFCLYDGGHSFRSNNIAVAWRMFEAAGKI